MRGRATRRTLPRKALEALRLRFQAHCRPRNAHGCIESTYKLHPSGYPWCWAAGRPVSAIRIAWLLDGRVLPGVSLRRSCGNRRCVAVEHIVPWTKKDPRRIAPASGVETAMPWAAKEAE